MIGFRRLAGLAGVAPDENSRARSWGRRFEWPLIGVALWIPIQWYLETKGLLPTIVSFFGDWLIWLFFFTETAVLTTLVNNPARHLRRNWMNLAIIVAGLPVIWNYTPLVGVLRSLRLLLLIGIFVRISRAITEVLTINSLGTTLAFSTFVIIVSGALISTIDPAIPTVVDGIWWAWVTVTTVGYGDLVPVSDAGKFFASLIILLGVGLFSLLTANISAFLIGRDVRKEESEMRGRLRDIQEKLERIERRLEHMDRDSERRRGDE